MSHYCNIWAAVKDIFASVEMKKQWDWSVGPNFIIHHVMTLKGICDFFSSLLIHHF